MPRLGTLQDRDRGTGQVDIEYELVAGIDVENYCLAHGADAPEQPTIRPEL